MSDAGDAHVIAYLTGVTEADVDRVAELLCDALRTAGLAVGDEDDPVRALVGVKAEAFPDLEGDGAGAFLNAHAHFVIPQAEVPR